MLPAILALDLGQQTGWALRTADGLTTSGTVAFRPGRFEGGGMPFLRFRHWLTEIKATAGGVDALYFEEVRRHAGTTAAHVYGGFPATLTAWAEHHSIPYAGVPVGTIKRQCGNACRLTSFSTNTFRTCQVRVSPTTDGYYLPSAFVPCDEN